MKTIKNTLLALALIVTTSAFAQTYTADAAKSELAWIGKKVSGQHNGLIDLKSGSFEVKDKAITSGEFIINMTSITCLDLEGEWNEKLVGHLKSDDFFGVNNYPTAKLVITEGGKFKNGVASVKGNLSIKGKTHPVNFEVKQDGKTFITTVTVDRTLYNIKYGSGKFFDNLGDNMIDDNFTLDVKLVTK